MRVFTGIVLIVLAAVCFGFMGLFNSWPSSAGVSVEMILFLRFAIAGVVMAAIMLMRRDRLPRGRVLAGVIVMGAVLYFGESMFFFHAMRHIPVGLVSLLLYVYPVVVTLFAWLCLRERLGAARMVALGLAIIGLALTIGPTVLERQAAPLPGANPWLGVALGLGCCLSYSIYILIGGGLTRRAGAIPGSTVVILSAAAVFGILVWRRGDPLPPTSGAWLGVSLLALVSTVVAITAVLVGLERIGPVRTSMLSTLEPVVTVIVGATLMGQGLTAVQMAGGALIVGAAVVVARSSREKSSKHALSNVEVLEIH